MSIFTPSTKLSSSTNPRDWAYELACLPQSASIVFTKETLLAFLKTHNIEVSPNYTEINKLPRYAQIGTMTAIAAPSASERQRNDVTELPDKVAAISVSEPPRSAPAPPASAAASLPVPSVAQPAAPSQAPTPPSNPVQPVVASTTGDPSHQSAKPTSPAVPAESLPHNPDVVTPDGQEFRPTRRVREPIGGGSALIAALFGDDDESDFTAEAAKESARRRGLLQERPQEQVQAAAPASAASTEAAKQTSPPAAPADSEPQANENVFRPTRRVREPGGTGGSSSIVFG